MAQRSKQEMMREHRETSRDVGRHRHTRCIEIKRQFEFDLRGFILYFCPRAVPLKFAEFHEQYIASLQDIILHGGEIAVALPRGSGKTTINVIAALWAMLYWHRRYVAVVAATAAETKKIMGAVKKYLTRNARIRDAFPEICHYTWALGGQSQRAAGQLADGETTDIRWTSDNIVFPNFERNDEFMERAAQSVFEARGISGSIRGMQYMTSDGEIIRPDLVILDDPQTRESAKSPVQTATIMELIDGDILGCDGPDSEIAAIMGCTVIAENDLSETYLARWGGVRRGFVEQWPEDEELWNEYMALHSEVKGMSKQSQRKRLNVFYEEHRAEMDRGAVVTWPERVLGGALSGIQTAYDRIAKIGKPAFFAEYQNKPLKQNETLYTLSTELILSRTNGLEHRAVPMDTPLLFCAADINHYAISYAVCAFRNDFTAYVVDYGWFPDGGCVYDPKKSAVGEQAAIFDALTRFVARMRQMFPALQLIGIDGNYFTAVVNKFVQASAAYCPVRILPLRGVAAKQYREPTQSTPGIVGRPRLRCCMKVNSERVLYAPFDSHYWHMFQQKMWLLQPGAPGSTSLFTSRLINHRRFAEQVTADKLRDVYERYGEMIYEWSTIGLNEMSDALTMCMVLANLAGLDPAGTSPPQEERPVVQKRKRIRPQIITN